MKFELPKILYVIGGIVFLLRAGMGLLSMALAMPLVVSAFAKTDLVYMTPYLPIIYGIEIAFEIVIGCWLIDAHSRLGVEGGIDGK